MNRLIDTHDYIGSSKILNVDVHPEHYRKLKDEIKRNYDYDARFLVMTYSNEGNLLLPEIVKSNPDLFLGGIIQINPSRIYEKIWGYLTPKELEGIIKSGGIVGLKVHTSAGKVRVDSESLDDFASLAIDQDVPIVFHCSATTQNFTHPDYFRRLKEKHPDLKIVCAHYGGLNEKYIPENIKLLNEYPNIYLNTAGLSGEIARRQFEVDPRLVYHEDNPERWVNEFLQTIEPIQDKVVFGSDYPELKFTIHPIGKAKEEIQQKLLYINPAKIFKLGI